MTGPHKARRLAAAIFCALSTAAAVPAAAGETPRIGVSLPLLAGPWYTAILYGLEAEADARGAKLVVTDAGGYGHIGTQVDQMANLVAQGVDAILADPTNPDALNGVARMAGEAGIPLLGLASPVVASQVPAAGSVSSSHCDLGRAMAEGARALLPEGGTVGALAGPAGAFWAGERYRCFAAALADSDIRIVAMQNGDQDTALAMSTAADMLQRFPDLSLLYGADDSYGVGAARAVEQIGGCGKVKVLMAVLGEAAEDMMRRGCADYVVAQKPVLIARQALAMALELAAGATPEAQEIVVPVVPVTAASLQDVDLGEIRQPAGWQP
ncbi:substrate-binding domain-containing protein [Poseidonocella sp. HB161398]|uniref:substrate-binding domain-containing protein n=1 Tax=Poseidonocella sp. HB161398 TaxID=2320855 RepID=UPI0011093ECA|nr:substrate-binding domain-containing protein [Poseidonocella sp. HB161398]